MLARTTHRTQEMLRFTITLDIEASEQPARDETRGADQKIPKHTIGVHYPPGTRVGRSQNSHLEVFMEVSLHRYT